MPRFLFHVLNSNGLTLDDEGLEYANLDGARVQAVASIRSILAEELKSAGMVDLRGRIDIVDEEGTVTSIPFASAVTIYAEG